MKGRSTAGRDLVIGLVFLGALGLFGWGTLKVVTLDVLGRSRDIEVPFSEVNGIRVGDDVKFHGYSVGLVTGVEPRFERQTRLVVKCRINTPIRLPEDSRFVVRSAGPLGGRFIEIDRGDSEKLVSIETGAFRGEAEGDLFDNLGRLVDEIKEGNGLLNQLIHNERIGSDFERIVTEIREVVSSVNEGEGILGALIKREDLRQRAEELINDAAATMKEIREGTGTVGKLINEDEVYDDLREAIGSVKSFTKRLDEGDGALQMLLSDPEVKKDLKDSVAAFKDTISGINEGEGTIGQLVKNREAYDQLMRILDNLADAVEDFREQAPISTFVNAIFTGL